MANIEPFRGLRYSSSLGRDLSAVTAPPYDVIDEALQRELLAEPHNIAHLDLNPGPLDPADPSGRYQQAARLLNQWRQEGILRLEERPALYLCEQTYDWDRERLTRRSFIARVRLEPLGSGSIFPHERTFSGPKQDRFDLMVATRCGLSQVLGFYHDPGGEVTAPFGTTAAREPDLVATGRDGVLNRVWVETDPAVTDAVCRAMAGRDLFIADGHHRYETALRYRDEAGGGAPAADYASVVCVGSGDPGLRLMPTHRIARGLRGFAVERLRDATAGDFEWVRPAIDPTNAAGLERYLADVPLSSVGLLRPDGFWLLRLRREALPDAALPGGSATLRKLNVAVLHQWLLPKAVEPLFGAPELQYVHTVDEAVAALAGGADAAFLLRGTPLETVIEVAGGRELMPQKSTYFYPKVLTGLVLYPLEGG